MEITKVKETGLKKEFDVAIKAKAIVGEVEKKLTSMLDKVKIPGFRPGKVPMSLMQERYGETAEKEVVEDLINKAASQVIKEHKLRPALSPKFEGGKYEKGKDFNFTLQIEVMPQMDKIQFDDMKLQGFKVKIEENKFKEVLEQLAKDYGSSEPIKTKRKAKKDDIAVINFKGFVDGEPLKNGDAENYELTLGSNSFIAGFEEGVTGMMPGEEKKLNLSFPKDYAAEQIAGKKVVFEVKLNELREPRPAKIDDAFAKKLGMSDLNALKDAIKGNLHKEYDHLIHDYHKQEILDHFAKKYSFEVPEGMVDLEMQSIIQQLRQSLSAEDKAAKKPDDLEKEWRKEYQEIAQRRVRLGLILAEIANQNNISVTNEELGQAVMEQARNYPGEEQKVIDYYRNNSEALANVRAPILEKKVVEFILKEQVKQHKEIGVDDLLKMVDNQQKKQEEAPKPKKTKKAAAQ